MGTLLLSLGVPMMLGGDEVGRTQRGNNNAYSQDNEISWYDWKSVDKDLLAFTAGLVAVRRRHPVLRRRRFASGVNRDDIRWFTPTGSAMTDSDWNAGWTRSVVASLDGSHNPDRDDHGRPILDDDLLLIVNGWWEQLTFTLPDVGSPRVWLREVDTFTAEIAPAGAGGAAGTGHGARGRRGSKTVPGLAAGASLAVQPRSAMLLRSARR
jgi:glycogen operon protein